MIVVVTYDLNTANADYTPFYESLKAQGDWWHYLKSTWLISTNKSPLQISNEVLPKLYTNDRLLVARLSREMAAGWLAKEAWDWISARISKWP